MKKLIYLFCLGLMMATSASAQEEPMPNPFTPWDLGSGAMDDDPAGTDNGNPGGIPVDGGLSLLLAAGAAYGVRRLRGRKEKK
jgi:hypothetical protein